MAGKSVNHILSIEFLYPDLTTCERCVGTEKNLHEAIELVRPTLARIGVELRLRRIQIAPESEARMHRLVSSPTIRVNGTDIASELIETDCASCGELCNCAGGVDCRIWRWNGSDYTAAPVGMIAEAVMRAAFDPSTGSSGEKSAYETPENLRRFFGAKESEVDAVAMGCCSSEEQESCCAPSEKADCCTSESSVECACV